MAESSLSAATPTTRPQRRVRQTGWTGGLLIAVVVFYAILALTVEHFGTARNLGFLFIEITPTLLLALALALVIITGEIDLSIASTVGLSGAVAGLLWQSGMAFGTIVLIVLLLGVCLGLFNGVFVAFLGLPSIAVTVATLALYRGLTYVLLGDRAVTGFPRSMSSYVLGTIPGTPIPNIVIPVLAIVGIFAVLLHKTLLGRDVLAVGANPLAARYSGVNAKVTKLIVFVLSGATASAVGIFWILRYSTARADNASGLELAVVAAVILGGVSILGGSGNALGVVAGVALLGGVQNALRLAGVSADALTALIGALLLFAVLAPNLAARAAGGLARRSSRRKPAEPT